MTMTYGPLRHSAAGRALIGVALVGARENVGAERGHVRRGLP